METTNSKTYKVLGTTDDFTVCELCGRSDLKATVALSDQDGNVVHFGSDCAARAAGWTVKEVALKVQEAYEAKEAEREAAFNAYIARRLAEKAAA